VKKKRKDFYSVCYTKHIPTLRTMVLEKLRKLSLSSNPFPLSPSVEGLTERTKSRSDPTRSECRLIEHPVVWSHVDNQCQSLVPSWYGVTWTISVKPRCLPCTSSSSHPALPIHEPQTLNRNPTSHFRGVLQCMYGTNTKCEVLRKSWAITPHGHVPYDIYPSCTCYIRHPSSVIPRLATEVCTCTYVHIVPTVRVLERVGKADRVTSS
jgi:hypothetical protein